MDYPLKTLEREIPRCCDTTKGSSNPHNVVKATFDALSKMRDPVVVAQQRGISLSKVFNG
jgi:ribosomal protein S5